MRSRRALLDALEALADHREGVILIGAHAIYVYTGEADVPIATRTKLRQGGWARGALCNQGPQAR